MQAVLYKPSQRKLWEALVASSSDATVGHLWEWGDVVREAYGFKPFYVVAENTEGRPLAGAPFIFVRSVLYGNELTSLPYIDYGGICHIDGLSTDLAAQVDAEIYRHAYELARVLGAKRLQMRSLRPCNPPFEVSTEKVTQHLTLASTVDEQLRRLPSERRNRLKKCAGAELTTEISPVTDERKLAEFYAVYSENMRDLGSPTHSFKFIRSLAVHMGHRLRLILVRRQAKALAAGVAMEFRRVMSLPWTGATLKARAVYGSNALYWSGICLGIERGCHTFDFGRSTVNSGIYEFKRQWGPSPVQAYWSTLYLKPGAKRPKDRAELQLASLAWRYVPLGMSRLLGPVLRRGISN